MKSRPGIGVTSVYEMPGVSMRVQISFNSENSRPSVFIYGRK